MSKSVYAYFLPQFYSTPENDEYWGKGFTEWTNIQKAKAQFRGHRCPLYPANNDYYDLSKLTDFERLIDKSLSMGLNGFAYWHYWFGEGRITLEKVPQMHLREKRINQDFFFAWANHNWTQSWIGKKENLIFKQHYNLDEVDDHLDYLTPFFEDSRYLFWNQKPLFQVLFPYENGVIPYIYKLEEAAIKRFGTGLHWLFPTLNFYNKIDHEKLEGLDFHWICFPPDDIQIQTPVYKWRKKLVSMNPFKKPVATSVESIEKRFEKLLKKHEDTPNYVAGLLSGWDTTYRYGRSGSVHSGSIEEQLTSQIKVLDRLGWIEKTPFLLVKAFNEWAEGNILENYEFEGEVFNLEDHFRDLIDTYIR
jgi:hypothetical protein